MNERSESDRIWLDVLIVLILTVAAHVHGLRGQFVEWDDTSHITRNLAIRSLSFQNLRVMFTQPTAKLYCPLTWLSFAIDYQIWGHDPFGYHLTNLLLHIANTLLVLLLVWKVLRGRYAYALTTALLTAVMFGVHPLHVESVAWATERKDVLFVFFYLLGLLSYFRWLDSRKLADYGICFGCFVASVLSKSTAVTFPVVLLLIDLFVAKRKAWGEKVPFFAVSLIIAGITFVCQAGGLGETVATPEIIPLWARAGLVGYCSLFYVRKFFWPVHLSAVYPSFDEMHWNILLCIEYMVAFALVTALVFAARRRWPALWPSWLFYIIALSPTIGLVPVGIHVVADRYSHLAILGLMLPVSMVIAQAARAARGAGAGSCWVERLPPFSSLSPWRLSDEPRFGPILRRCSSMRCKRIPIACPPISTSPSGIRASRNSTRRSNMVSGLLRLRPTAFPVARILPMRTSIRANSAKPSACCVLWHSTTSKTPMFGGPSRIALKRSGIRTTPRWRGRVNAVSKENSDGPRYFLVTNSKSTTAVWLPLSFTSFVNTPRTSCHA